MSIKIQANPSASGSTPTGGLTYKGSYDAALQSPNLDSSLKGDFYIVSDAGSLAGVALNVGDHIVFNQDASSPITSAMFDVIDNTDAVASVNALTGTVVLNLKTINDVNATLTPSDSTFLVGDGSQWTGESGATARTSLGLGTVATLDFGTGANQVVQLTAASKLPAVDGSLLTNLPGGGDLLASNNLSDLDNAGTARTNLGLAIGTNVQAFDAQLTDVAGLTPTDGNIIIGDGSNFVTESGATARTSLGLAIGTNVQAFDAQLTDIAGLTPTDSHIIVGDGSNFVTESGATARTSLGLGTVATLDVGTGANQVVQLTAASKLPAVDGSLLTNLPSSTDTLDDVVGRGATTATPITVGDLKINSDSSGSSTGGSIATTASNNNIKLDPHGSGVPELVGNATRGSGQVKFNCEQNTHGIVLKGPPHSAAASYTMILPDGLGSNGQVLSLQDSSTGELTFVSSGAGDLLASNNLSDLDNAGTARTNLGLVIGTNVQAFDAQLTDVAGLTPTDGNIIVGDGSNFVTESGATARTSLGLAIGSDVQAFDAQLTDIAGLTPTDSNFIVGDGSNFILESGLTARTSLGCGSAATFDAGANSANQLVQLTAAAKLPAVDGSLLTNLPGGGDLLASNNLSDLDNAGTARTNLGLSIGSDVQAFDAQLTDVAGLTPTDGNIIIGDGSNFITESGATARTSLGLSIGSDVQAFDAQLTDVAGLTPSDGGFIVGDGSNFVLETTGDARTSLGLGTVATLDVGTSANQVVQLTAAAKLPAVDGSLLTNLPSGGGLTYQARDTTAHSPLTPLANYHYSINANSATMVINLPALSSFTDGDQIRVKFQARGDAARDVTINRNGTDTIDGQTSVTLDVLYSSVTLVAGSSEWEIV